MITAISTGTHEREIIPSSLLQQVAVHIEEYVCQGRRSWKDWSGSALCYGVSSVFECVMTWTDVGMRLRLH